MEKDCVICDKCGKEMFYFREYSSQGWNCPNCGWGIATTYIAPIYEDDTLYTITINSHVEPTKAQLSVVSKIMMENYLAAKKLLINGGTLIGNKYAPEIKEIVLRLKEANVDFIVTPNYKYLYKR